MRDINRIDKVLEEIGKVWKTYPDMRLGQLILNVLKDPALYYIEDSALVDEIKNYYGVGAEEPEIIYGKVQNPDGTISETTHRGRKFGKTIKACFACKKDETCTAKTVDECEFEKPDNVELHKGL